MFERPGLAFDQSARNVVLCTKLLCRTALGHLHTDSVTSLRPASTDECLTVQSGTSKGHHHSQPGSPRRQAARGAHSGCQGFCKWPAPRWTDSPDNLLAGLVALAASTQRSARASPATMICDRKVGTPSVMDPESLRIRSARAERACHAGLLASRARASISAQRDSRRHRAACGRAGLAQH